MRSAAAWISSSLEFVPMYSKIRFAFEPWKRSMRIALRELGVVRRDQAAVAEAEEVLGGIEAEGRCDSGSGDLGRAEGLRGVLDQGEPELGELGERRRAARTDAPA